MLAAASRACLGARVGSFTKGVHSRRALRSLPLRARGGRTASSPAAGQLVDKVLESKGKTFDAANTQPHGVVICRCNKGDERLLFAPVSLAALKPDPDSAMDSAMKSTSSLERASSGDSGGDGCSKRAPRARCRDARLDSDGEETTCAFS